MQGEHPVIRELPPDHSKQIGRIINHSAYLDWRLRNVAQAILGVPDKHARIALREPRASTYAVMLMDLMLIEDIKPTADMGALKKVLEQIEDIRDSVAHGLWLKVPESTEPVMQYLRGNWTDGGRKPTTDLLSNKRKIEPEGVVTTAAQLSQWVDIIDRTADDVAKLEGEVREILAKQRAESSQP